MLRLSTGCQVELYTAWYISEMHRASHLHWILGKMMKMEQKYFTKEHNHRCRGFVIGGGGLCLGAAAFDLCFTAGPGEDVSVGSCRRLISPSLTQAQLVDSTLWHFARKVVRAPSDKSPERIPRLLSQA